MSQIPGRNPQFWLCCVLLVTSPGCTSLGTNWPWPGKGAIPSVAGTNAPNPGEGKQGPAGNPQRNLAATEESGIQPVGHTGGPGANGAANPAATRPTVVGHPLNLAPGESPVEKSLDLSRRLAAAEEQNLAMAAHAQHLRAQIEQRDGLLREAEKEVRTATEEVAQARAELHQYKQQLQKLRDRMRAVESDNDATLRSIITWLERLLDGEKKEKPAARTREPEEKDFLLEPVKPSPKK